jgi:hypothetical protein
LRIGGGAYVEEGLNWLWLVVVVVVRGGGGMECGVVDGVTVYLPDVEVFAYLGDMG